MTEIPDELDCLEDDLISRKPYYRQNEKTVLSICSSIRCIERHSLDAFWYHPFNHDRMIDSFGIVGANKAKQILKSSASLWALIEDEAQGESSDVVDDFGRLEEEFTEEVPNVYDLTLVFVLDNKVHGHPLSLLEYLWTYRDKDYYG